MTGDAYAMDEDGYFYILDRKNDMLISGGYNVYPREVEDVLLAFEGVVEAAVVGMPHEIKGTGIAAFVTLGPGASPSEELKSRLREHVSKEIGAIAKPDMIRFTSALPKTRSGKIMRRLLRDVAEGRNLGDTTTLADASVVNELQRRAADTPSED